MTDERRTLVEKAKLAEQLDRWDDVTTWMKAVVKLGRDLTVDERNLLATAYKNFVGRKRAAWRVVSGIEQKVELSQRKREISKEYRRRIESELKTSCTELLQLIEKHLLGTIDVENQIFYLKLKGDYYRYLAEFCRDGENGDVFDNARQAYEQATELAKENLTPAHPMRLGLILNFSVYYYEILNKGEKACSLAKNSLTEAREDTSHSHMTETARNDSAAILQLLEDNLALWAMEIEGGVYSTNSMGSNCL